MTTMTTEQAEAAWSAMAFEANGGRYPGRNNLPALLFGNFWDLPKEVQPVALLNIWTMAEFPGVMLEYYEWNLLFHEVGITHNARRVRRVRSVPTLWRAATPDYAVGMSWTPDRAEAERFLLLRPGSQLYSLDGEAADYLSLATCDEHYGRGELEYILDAERLHGLEEHIQLHEPAISQLARSGC